MDKFSVRAVIRATGISATIALLAVSISVQARALDLQQRQQFSIPSESLNAALTAFSAQTRIHVVTSRVPADALSPGVSGDVSTLNALTALLRGTRMAFRQIDAETIVVLPEETAAKLRRTQLQLVSDVADQDALATAPTAAAAPAAAATAGLAEVQVTGTRIIRNGYEAPTPLTVVSTADLLAASPVNIADFVNDLPALAGSETPTNSFKTVSSGNQGLNLLNLRDLGTSRTLVLVDGQRWVTEDTNGEVDVNNIPHGLVSRVDIVTGGASAVYGSDAVAGVVNFVLDTTFTGFKGEVSGGETTYGDDPNWKVSLTWGTPFDDNRGHFLIEGDLFDNYGIPKNPRAWALTGWKDMENPNYTATNGQPRQLVLPDVALGDAAPGGMIATGPLMGTYFGPGGTPLQFHYGPLVSAPLEQGGDWLATDNDTNASLDTYDYHQGLYSRASFDISDNVNVHVQYTYASTHTRGVDSNEDSLGGLTVNVSNPFLPASVAAAATADHLTTLTLGTTYQDLPTFASEDYRTVNRFEVGGNGKFDAFGTRWTWDTYVEFGISDVTQLVDNVTDNTNLAAAQNAVRAPNGSIVCAASLLNPNPDPGCVPFDLFGTGVNSAAAVNYVEGQAHENATFEQTAGALDLQGEPFNDWAGPVSLAFGADGRRESATGVVGPEDQAVNEFAGNLVPVIGHYQVWEGYLETVVPLTKELDFNGAARATDYSVSGYVTTWKLGLTWSPINDIRFRATESSDIRAPNLADLYAKGVTNVTSFLDPLLNNISEVAHGLASGNINLVPEKAKTSEVGFVVQPRFMPGFSGSVDFYYIDISDAIASPGAQNEVYFCADGLAIYCPDVIRGGPVVNGVSEITFVKTTSFNEAAQTESGIDFDLSYRTQLAALFPSASGNLTLRFLTTRYFYDISYPDLPGTVPTNAAGANSGSLPSWRYYGTIAYDNDPWNVTLNPRGISAGVYSDQYIQCTSNCPTSGVNYITVNNNHLPGAWYLDGNVSYTFHEGNGNAAQDQVFLSVTNIFNRNPPPYAPGPGGTTFNMYPANPILYDVIGRTIHVGVRFSL